MRVRRSELEHMEQHHVLAGRSRQIEIHLSADTCTSPSLCWDCQEKLRLGLATAIPTSFGGGLGEKLHSPPQLDRCLESANKDSVKSVLGFWFQNECITGERAEEPQLTSVWLSAACWVFAQFSYWEGSSSASGICWEVPGNVCICQRHLMLTAAAAGNWAGQTALSHGPTGLSSVQVRIHQVAPLKDFPL